MSDPTTLPALLRAFVVDWLCCADAEACRRIMHPSYRAVVGGVALEGREEAYLPATTGQLERFPGLLVTAHELVVGEGWAALRFSEHGTATGRGSAAWGGIGLFHAEGGRLVANITEEDYLARRRQLATGRPDPVAAPATDPFAVEPAGPDPAIEEVVRAWLGAGGPAGADIAVDDGWTGQPTPALVEGDEVEIDTLWSAGVHVGFHLTQRGTYLGGLGLDGVEVGASAALRVCGLVAVDASGAIRGHVVRDRVGLRRELLGRAEGPSQLQ